MSLILSGTNGLSDVDGSAATPAIRGTDTNTGIFFPAADTIAFAEGGVEAMRLDSSGNLGIGTTSPTGGANRVVDVYGSGSSAINFHNATSGTTSTDGGVVGQYGSDLVLYNYEAGIIQFGTSNAERMRLDASGNLGLGTTSPTSYGSAYSVFEVAGSVSGVINVKSGSTLYGQISNGTNLFKLDAVGASSSLLFLTNTTERARINSSGSLLVGTTTDYATLSSRRTQAGAALYAGQAVATNDYTALIEQTVSGGNGGQNIGLIVRIQASGASDRILACQFNNAGSPQDKMYVQRDGSSYNSTGTWGTISDARIKQDITDASSQWEDFKKIKFRKYRLIDDVVALADEAPYLMGPVAQELEEAGMNGLVETPTQVDGTEMNKQVKLSIMYMKGMKALQEAMLRIEEQQAIITQLQADVAALKGNA